MDSEPMEILENQALSNARESREAKLAEFEARRLARSLVVPTDDAQVTQELRKRSQPVCFYGEDAHDRRERLRQLMAVEVMKKGGSKTESENESENEQDSQVQKDEKGTEEKEEFFTKGSDELKQLRLSLTKQSLVRAQKRLERERQEQTNKDYKPFELQAVTSARESNITASYIGDTRPLSAIAYVKHDGSRIVASGSWGGTVKLWQGKHTIDGEFECKQTLLSHDGRISKLRLLNSAESDGDGMRLLSCGCDGWACIYAINTDADSLTVTTTYKKSSHGNLRVSDMNMHPFHRSLLVTGGYDGDVVLHDIATEQEICRQPTGHESVYRLSFHPDGSLLSTCGLEGGIRLYDLRSGRVIMTLTKAHADNVLGIEFSPNGHVLASGGADNLVRIWDLRSIQCVKSIAAHKSLVSDVSFAAAGNVLYTASFDHSVKCYATRRNYGLIAVHSTFEDKVTALDCLDVDGTEIVTSCYDKTWKVIGADQDKGQ